MGSIPVRVIKKLLNLRIEELFYATRTRNCNNDDRCLRQKQGVIVGAVASETRAPPKARSGCWEPQPGRAAARRRQKRARWALFLVFGSQSSGMSTVVAAASFDPNGNQSKNSPACTIRQAGVRYARKQMMSFYGLWPMPPSSVRVSPDIYLKSGMASWTQTRPISVSALP